MSDADLDRCYTALCHALASVGPQRSEMLLSMLSLALLARSDAPEDMLALISRVATDCQDPVPHG